MLRVSVIITNYNYGRFLGRCIRSVLAQSFPSDAFEAIVVDDGSTDESRKVIESFGDKVRAIYLPTNHGVAYASNAGVKASRGMYVIRIDADDYISFRTLDVLLLFLEENKDKSFAYCDHTRVNILDQREERINLDTEEKLLDHGAGVLFKKTVLEAIGLYDEEMLNCEDLLLIKKLLRNGFEGIHVSLPLYRYMRHGANMTEDKASRDAWKQKAEGKISQ